MNELYELIEEKIKASGYPGEVDGREFYDDISDEADEKENRILLRYAKTSIHLLHLPQRYGKRAEL